MENTYPREENTAAVVKACQLVQSFIGAPVFIDASDLGAAAHRVRLLWTNFIKPEIVQAPLPTGMKPTPALDQILHHDHIPTQPGYEDRYPFARHNRVGSTRLCMPTLVLFLRSNAFRPKANGSLGEGEVYNTSARTWEEPKVEEKETLMGYAKGTTITLNVTENQRSIRIGRALDGTTMRWLGAFIAAKHK